MAEQKNERILMLKDVRLSFPVLFEAKPFSEGGKSEFSASFLISKDSPQVAEIKAAIAHVGKEKWGVDSSKVLTKLFNDDRLCFHDGDKKDYDGYAGNFFIRANNQIRPLIIDRNRAPLTAKDGRPYSGCYVNATISLWAQDNKYGKRINANLRGVQFFRDGEAFTGGGTASVDEFSDEGGGTGDSFDAAGSDMFT